MATALTKAQRKLRTRDIYYTVRKLMDPETGELIGALVPDHPVDRRSMRERKFHVGKQLRGAMRQARNPKFYRKAHVLSGWLVISRSKPIILHGRLSGAAMTASTAWLFRVI